MTELRVGVLISGRGSNLQALIDAAADPAYPARICLVLSNRPGAAGLERARAAGIATAVIEHGAFADRAAFDDALDEALTAHAIDLVCLAGFMRLLGPAFVERWRDRLVNIHPALLPSFKGADAVEQALASGVKVTGCTLHFVRTAMDDGPIIAQVPVPVLPGDDVGSLSARIRAAEHECYPWAVRLIAEGKVKVVDERVVVAAE